VAENRHGSLIQVKALSPVAVMMRPMTKAFSTFALTAEQIPLVFPLVSAAAPEIDLARWRSFARPLAEDVAPPKSGAIGLRNAAGYVCGLIAYRVDRHLRHGLVLAIDLFIVLDLVNDEDATEALLQVAEAKALELHCTTLHIRSDRAQIRLRHQLAATGHREEASLFCKAVAPGAPPS
jgi:hypothetical protein